MNAVIDLSTYAPLLGLEEHDAAEGLSLPFFKSCTFESRSWVLRSYRNEGQEYVLRLAEEPIGPENQKLGDNPDLLRTVKLHLILAYIAQRNGRPSVLGVSLTTAEAIYMHYLRIIDLIRYLDYQLGLNNLSSINQAVADKIVYAYKYQTRDQRLELGNRAVSAIKELFSDEKRLSSYSISGSSADAKPRFDHNRFSDYLGVSTRALQGLAEYQKTRYQLLKQHGFACSKKTPKVVENGGGEQGKSETTVRKPLVSIKAFFQSIFIFVELFPESQRLQQGWLSSLEASKVAKKVATRPLVKTRDIPKKVFYQLMDEAIRWVLDYSGELIGYRDEVKTHYQFLLADRKYNVSNTGTEASRKHYAAKKMRDFFYRRQPKLFPFTISSIDRTQPKTNERQIEPAKVEEVKRRIQDGLTLQNIANQMGVSRATVQRWSKWVPPLKGASLELVINKHLVSACLLVIFAFTGRRKGEVMGLNVGCIEEDNGSFFFVYDQEKYFQGERAIPTTKLVKKAVDVLETLRANDNGASRTGKLLRLPKTVSDANQEAWPNFNAFCEFTKIPTLDDHGHNYSFADHQFRRFLAMTYWYRYPDPDLPTLSWFLGHQSTEMTMQYITDDAGQWALKSVKNERIVDLIEEELRPGTSVIGDELKELMGVIDGEVESRVERMEKKGELADHYQLNFVADGACFGRTEQYKLRSKCIEDGEVQLSAAQKGSCNGCANLLPVDQSISKIQIQDLTVTSSPMLAAVNNQREKNV